MTPLTLKIISIVLLSTVLGTAHAASEDQRAGEVRRSANAWLEQDYPYFAVDQTLSDALRELGHNLDLAIDVSPSVRGRLRRYHHEGSTGDFLDYLQSEHRLDWVQDAGHLYISSSDEKVSRSWSSSAAVFGSAQVALTEAGLDDPRYPISFDAGRGMINMHAPPRYVALASPVIDRVLTPKTARTVNIIHGRQRTGGT